MLNEKENGARSAFLDKICDLKVIVLDCDGVLFDSREANVQFYNHMMEVIGRPPVQPEQHEFIHMHPVRQSLLYLIGDDGADFERAFAYFEKIDFDLFNGHLQQEPGLIEFLRSAQARYRTALATNRTSSTLQLLNRYDLSRYFDLVVCASDVLHPKPHPETMQRIFSEFGAFPAQVLYIGDSRVDEAFARATGVIFVGYKNSDLRADFHIRHFNELGFLFSGNGAESSG